MAEFRKFSSRDPLSQLGKQLPVVWGYNMKVHDKLKKKYFLVHENDI